jgi:hypothetical protein
MRSILAVLVSGLAIAAVVPVAASGPALALLVQDSILDAEAHYFPQMTYGVPTVHGVTFQQEGVVEYKGWQYATYYNGPGHVSVGRRPLPGGQWETLNLTDYTFTTVDSHNSVVIGICAGDGTIHLSFDHHNVTLKYRVSVPGAADEPSRVEWTPALFGPILNRLDGATPVTDVTYPRFIPSPDGRLLFTYRIGGSGAGDEILYEYDGSAGQWTRIGLYIGRGGSYSGLFTASSTSRNAYPDNTLFDRNGRLHMTWCWRETPDPRSNHDIYYAFSDDNGRTWKNQAGAHVATADGTPLRVDSPGTRVWTIPQNRNYINNSGMTVDAEGRVHVMAWHFPDSEPNQTSGFDTRISSKARFHHYWMDLDGTWRRNPTQLTGSRPKLVADDAGHLYLIYGGATQLQIATATPASGWSDWAEMDLSGALPQGRATEVNIVIDPFRWEADRILSVYAQETNISGTGPTPLHVMDYHVSRGAVLPEPVNGSRGVGLDATLRWIAGRGAVAHEVYWGRSREAVEAAAPGSPGYVGQVTGLEQTVDGLEEETRYYWRVDAVDGEGVVTRGKVWTFETVSFQPQTAVGRAFRSYGGNIRLAGELFSAGGDAADVMLYWGPADGGTEADAWHRVKVLGEVAPGGISAELQGAGEEAIFFRFFAVNDRGASWSPVAGVIAPAEDLARWRHSALLTINIDEGLAPLADFPVLVRLGAEEIQGFSHDQFRSPPFGDLRFSDVSGSSIFPFEVEQWNPAGISLVWVRIPVIEGTEKIRLWWGREGRNPPSQAERAAVWASHFAGVWHLESARGFAHDSSPQAAHASAAGVSSATTSIVAGAGRFDGSSSEIRAVNAPALNPAHITVEAWIRTTQSGIASIVGKDRTTAGGGRVWQFRVNNGKLEFIVFNNSSNASLVSHATVADGQWRHVAGTWDGQTVRVYVDGQLDGSAPFAGSLRAGQPNDVFIGRMETLNPGYFLGDIDEVRVSGVARSADWIRASWLNQRPMFAGIGFGRAEAADLDGDLLPDAWEMEHFGAVGIGSGRADIDTSGNGVSDLLAFATGVNPWASDGFPFLELGAGSDGLLPEFSWDQLAGGAGAVGVDYVAAGLRYVVEISHDLVSWSSGSEAVEFHGKRQTLPAGMERVTVNLRAPGGGAEGRLFARLRVADAHGE